MSNEYKNDPKKKRYYWLQLKEDFFNQKEIKLLRRIAGGDTYTIIYLKMLLLSLRHEGKLFFEAMGDDFSEEVALDLDESPEDVSLTLNFLESKGLLEIVEDDEYFLNKVPEMVGSESYSAERVREHRKRKREQNLLQGNATELQSNSDVNSCNEELELKLKLELKNKDIMSSKLDDASLGNSKIYSEIISYLNEKLGTSYRATSKATQTKIKARLGEGFTVDDFKKVIDTKASEWLNDPNMQQYLRPETLFGTKFESYLNQQPVKQPTTTSFTRDEDEYDYF